ncbi:putative amino acid/polyamine transporter 2 [Medicago truncatula]|uniref:Putative amino acid/polyamine transporter 2 n=1 Tax=Medicago truncatula TaxID=3880 RepID=A0A396HDW0_MEDTR|nr:putative amino acid/polyamine transporter 2 [Medicago truncatula]
MQQQHLHHLHKNLTYPKPNILVHKKIHFQTKKFITHNTTTLTTKPSNFLHIKNRVIAPENDTNINVAENDTNVNIDVNVENENFIKKNQCPEKKSFWGAVSLIIGAAVGPGMLGLPSLTIKSGPLPSTIIILISWLYVISSIILVAELCFDAMENDNVDEVMLGLVGANKGPDFVGDPITLLLSVNPSALSAVQGFAFSAMATSLIGYAVSLPKQILDTLELVSGKGDDNEYGKGRVGSVFYGGNGGDGVGYSGKVGFGSSTDLSEIRLNEERFDGIKLVVTLLVLCFSVLIASYFRSTFSRALDFAGVYANCFLFGIIPPVMTCIHQQSKKGKIRPSFIPGGNVTLLLLFTVSVILGIWH